MIFLTLWACAANTPADEHSPNPSPLESSEVFVPQEDALMSEEPQRPEEIVLAIYFTDVSSFRTGKGSFLIPVERRFSADSTPEDALKALYGGPRQEENTEREGLIQMNCESTGATLHHIENGLAYVQLLGGCGGCGSHTIYDEIRATLKEWPDINDVVLFGPNDTVKTNISEPKIPRCLQP